MNWTAHNEKVERENALHQAWEEYQDAVDHAIDVAFGKLHELGVPLDQIVDGLCQAPAESTELGDWCRWVEDQA